MAKYLLLIMALVCPGLVQAFTYMPMTDEALTRQSPVVVLGQVTQVAGSAVLNRSITEYQLDVVEVLKGEVPATSIVVQTPGVSGPAASGHSVPGMPSFSTGDALLLFLKPLQTGNYGIMHLGLGAFELVNNAEGEAVFVRDLEEAERLHVDVPLANAANEIERPAADFLASFGEEYRYIDTSQFMPEESQYQTANFTLLSTPPARWFEFDNNQNVIFRMHVDGQPGMTDGGEGAIRSAILAWTSDLNSNIRYVYGGTTTSTLGFTANDGINSIIFDDPNGEVDGTFTCQEGGVLAAGGYVSTGGTSLYNGAPYADILEADIITNDGAGCYFALGGDESYGEEIFGHELGHTLGFGHSCGGSSLLVLEDCDTATPAERDALMRAFPHADGRGADLRSDDRAAAAFLYEPNASTMPPPNDGGGDVVTDDEPGVNPGGEPASGGGGGGSGGGGGGGGCSLAAAGAGPIDPMLWLLSLASLLWLTQRKRVIHKP